MSFKLSVFKFSFSLTECKLFSVSSLLDVNSLSSKFKILSSSLIKFLSSLLLFFSFLFDDISSSSSSSSSLLNWFDNFLLIFSKGVVLLYSLILSFVVVWLFLIGVVKFSFSLFSLSFLLDVKLLLFWISSSLFILDLISLFSLLSSIDIFWLFSFSIISISLFLLFFPIVLILVFSFIFSFDVILSLLLLFSIDVL